MNFTGSTHPRVFRYMATSVTIGQMAFVFMSALGVLPAWTLWLDFCILAACLAWLPLLDALLLFVLNLSLLPALPFLGSDTLAMWRPLVLVMLSAWVAKTFWAIGFSLKRLWEKTEFLAWDKYLFAFAAAGLFSLLFARFKLAGVSQLIFWANAWIFYFLLEQALKKREDFVRLVRFCVVSLTILITTGFAQLIFTFFVSLDTFWVFWATTFTKLFYGLSFAKVALYSNSWFSYSAGRDLRMFSLMPDSQSFAYLCVYGITLATAFTLVVTEAWRRWLWSGIRFACLALILSGTRAAWVGMLAPVTFLASAKLSHKWPWVSKKFFWPFFIVVILFCISPLINRALSFARLQKNFQENFLDRARSIYDLNETSNTGRLLIWEESLRYGLAHPWGTGVANFLTSIKDAQKSGSYESEAESRNTRYNLPQKYVTAHNLYLHIFVEMGAVGLLAFGAFWISFGRTVWKFLRRREPEQSEFLYLLVFQAALVFLWLATASLFDVTAFNDRALLFFFIELAAAGTIVKKYSSLCPDPKS